MLNMAITLYEVFSALVPSVKQLSHNSKETKETGHILDSMKDKYQEMAVSKELVDRIVALANGNETIIHHYLDKAIISNKILNYVYYYITNDNAELVDLGEEEKEFANGISEYLGFGRIYKDSKSFWIGNADVGNMSDYTINNKTKFFIDIYDINDRKFDPNFVSAWQGRLYRLSIMNPAATALPGTISGLGINGRLDPNGLIHPVFFQNSQFGNYPVINKPHRPAMMSDELFAKFENTFSKYFGDAGKYYYEMGDNGMWNICIPRENGTVDNIIIDDGSILGGTKVSILGMYHAMTGNMDTIFVKVDNHPIIAQNIFNIPFYIMSELEVQEIFNDQSYLTGLIYKYVDMSNTEFMDALTKEEKYYFEKRLLAVTKVLVQSGQEARLRFNNYNSPSEFELVSDAKVKSPFAKDNTTISNIIEGLKITINDNKMTKEIPNTPKTFYSIEYEEI